MHARTIPWPGWRKGGLLYICPIPLSPRPRRAWCRYYYSSGSLIQNEFKRCSDYIHEPPPSLPSKMENNLRRFLAILEMYPFADCISDFYPNVPEPSHFYCHVIHIFKNMVTKRCRVNICWLTRDLLFTHKLWVYQSAIDKRLRITVNYRRLKRACRTQELIESHFPSIRTEIYFVCLLNRKGAYRILRICIYRQITENSHVKASGHSWNERPWWRFYMQLFKNASEM